MLNEEQTLAFKLAHLDAIVQDETKPMAERSLANWIYRDILREKIVSEMNKKVEEANNNP